MAHSLYLPSQFNATGTPVHMGMMMTKPDIEASVGIQQYVMHGGGSFGASGVAWSYRKWPNHEEFVICAKEFEHLFMRRRESYWNTSRHVIGFGRGARRWIQYGELSMGQKQSGVREGRWRKCAPKEQPCK